ncbi:MAG: 2-octaprenyl-6-methoxyphenyl hydroxylase [Rhodospirillaceae bacterium]|nr:2-octaprenyl-6-methoxyphenyl hydroxylase [Rhodospirillaceae bacterium]|tara:strand:+ start:59880 stop:61115 length:1236 start_codon:yes stop_codon:yes gene_type:complete
MALASKNADETVADVLIVGGGMAGLILATALGNAGVDVVVVEPNLPKSLLDTDFDGRTTAIAAGSRLALNSIGAWAEMQKDAQSILDIRVTDGHSPLFLHYNHEDVAEGPLGHIVENRVIRSVLLDCLGNLPSVALLFGRRVKSLDRDGSFAEAHLDTGETVKARLAVATDGRGSPTRQNANIGVNQWRYPQTGIVCTVEHEFDHCGVAQEHFLPSGPFAILPMTERRSSIVWTEREDLAPAILNLPDKEFAEELSLRFGDYLGELEIIRPIFSYPLGLLHADSYIAPRLALAGDAAHAIHPIAGQGLNIGVRDAAALAEIIVDAMRLGLDPGSVNILENYERWRRFDNTMMIAATDGLNRLFSNNVGPIKVARDVGLAMVNRTPPLKRLFMRHAMGVLGDRPRLMRGELI